MTKPNKLNIPDCDVSLSLDNLSDGQKVDIYVPGRESPFHGKVEGRVSCLGRDMILLSNEDDRGEIYYLVSVDKIIAARWWTDKDCPDGS